MLDVRDYDLALVNRIKSFYENTHWISRHVIPIKDIRDQKVLQGKEVEFPLVTVRRSNCPIISKEQNSWPRALTGQPYNTGIKSNPIMGDNLWKYDKELAQKIKDTGVLDNVVAVNATFSLTYYIDIISFERDNFDALTVEIQENLLRIPYVGVPNIKSDGSVDKLIPYQACHLDLEEVEDTSDVENFDSGSGLFRATITLKVNAYIYRKYIMRSIQDIDIAMASMKYQLGDD